MMIQKKLTACVALLLAVFVGLSSGADTATPPAVVVEKASLWMDASDLTVGDELTSWADPRGDGYPVATTYTAVKPKVIEIESGALAGKNAVTFYDFGTSCDMSFEMRYMKMAFFVVDIDRSDNTVWLGCINGTHPQNYPFVRDATDYQFPNNLLNGYMDYYNNGCKVTNPTAAGSLPSGYQLVTWVKGTNPSAPNYQADCFTSDRGIAGRIGGKRLCEVVLFDESLSVVDQARVEAYLRAKWFGEQAEPIDYVWRKAQVHYDVSVASSVHLGTEGDQKDKVVQWDDLSGNGRTLTPYKRPKEAANYGGISIIGGRRVYDMGSVGSGIDMTMASELTTTRSVVMVTEIDASSIAFWLGSVGETYHFHRGEQGQFAHATALTILDRSEGWQNGQKVKSMVNDKPNGLGGLSVYVFNMSDNARWQFLSNDRDIGGRNGGKRLAELATFDFTLDDATRKAVEDYLMEKWSPTPECIENLMKAAWVHVSAAKADNFIRTDNAIIGWKNEGVDGDLFRELDEAVSGTRGYTNGVPAFMMGEAGSKIDLSFTQSKAIWNVFWVMDIQKSLNACFLGDSDVVPGQDGFDFIRGNNGEYAYSHSFTKLLYSSMTCDGEAVVPGTDVPPTGLHVFEAELPVASSASRLSGDRSGWATKNGGRALSELLILTNHVTGLTRVALSDYLANRWTKRCGWAGAGDSEWGEASYRVFDADAAVPADATAAGIGFTGDATLTGGPLAVGEGGVFISEGVTAALAVTMRAGQPPLALYGPGTFAVRSAIDYHLDLSHFANGKLLIEDGGVCTLPSAAVIQGLPLTVSAGGCLVLDLADSAQLPIQTNFESVAFEDGATVAIDTGTHKLRDNDYVVVWNTTPPPAILSTINFKMKNGAMFKVDEQGIRILKGIVVLIR